MAPRKIISRHSGSLLTEGDISNESLSEELLARIEKEVFTIPNPEASGGSTKAGGAMGNKKSGASNSNVSGAITAVKTLETLPCTEIPSALLKLGFEYAAAHPQTIEELIERFSSSSNTGTDEPTQLPSSAFTMPEFIAFVQRFQAPAYYYGTRLRLASARNEAKLVREYIIRGCDVNTGDGEGLTALHYACLHNHPDMVQFLADLCGDKLLWNPRDKSGCTPLYWACYMGHQELVMLMIKLGGDINMKNLHMKTCLHAAVIRSNLEIAQILTASGADVMATDTLGWTVYHEAMIRQGDAKEFMNYLDGSGEMKVIGEQMDVLGYTAHDYYRILSK